MPVVAAFGNRPVTLSSMAGRHTMVLRPFFRQTHRVVQRQAIPLAGCFLQPVITREESMPLILMPLDGSFPIMLTTATLRFQPLGQRMANLQCLHNHPTVFGEHWEQGTLENRNHYSRSQGTRVVHPLYILCGECVFHHKGRFNSGTLPDNSLLPNPFL